ncbi:MAG: hypothetical protein IGS48_14390 [Oscillatoriales cyanobacterium C42_A2020_001]|nr:hypothetical protein [Leptolyngbyaceae cyanobacterium C42_A2020_001]
MAASNRSFLSSACIEDGRSLVVADGFCSTGICGGKDLCDMVILMQVLSGSMMEVTSSQTTKR